MQPSIPQDIAIALPFLAALISHWLMADRLEAWKNAAIAAIFVIGTALACIWLSGSFVPGDPQGSVLLVVAYVALLMRGPLSVLSAFFADVPSPFDGPAPVNANPVTGIGTKAAVPSAIPLPSSVPPRASATQDPPKGA